MKKFTFYIFILVSVAELISVTFNMPLVNLIAKPLIMITLAGYYLTNTTRRKFTFFNCHEFLLVRRCVIDVSIRAATFLYGGTGFLFDWSCVIHYLLPANAQHGELKRIARYTKGQVFVTHTTSRNWIGCDFISFAGRTYIPRNDLCPGHYVNVAAGFI